MQIKKFIFFITPFMTNKNRDILFLIENTIEENEIEIHKIPLVNIMARNLMNKFCISEEDQYEISGFHAYSNRRSTKFIKKAAKQRKRYRELVHQREKIISKIPNASGTLDIFICGINFIRDFHVSGNVGSCLKSDL